MPPNQDHFQTLMASLERGLKHWHDKEEQITLRNILPNLTRHTQITWTGQRPVMDRQITNQLLLDLLTPLAEVNGEATTLLRRRYIDDEKSFAVANSLGISESFFYRRRRDALIALTEIAIAREDKARLAHITRLESRLETPAYHKLFGLSNLQARLSKLLCQKSDLKLFCLAGMGGIGKTTLAEALVREVIGNGCFDDFAWISARQEQFTPWGEIQALDRPVLSPTELITALNQQLTPLKAPPRSAAESLAALKNRLSSQAHLIILDNLETAVDYQELLPLLRDLSQFAWILVTSRLKMHEQPDIHTTNLTELPPTDAAALIQAEAFRRGIHDLAEASPETISQIYDVAGGNPLALKLIIGQMQIRSLSTVLTDLRKARGRHIKALYEYIYRQAWEMLDDTARRVLLTMPMVALPGATLDHLAGTTQLDYDVLNEALDLLIRLSLVQIGGSLDDRHYYIHRLTETFLHEQVSKWG